MTKEKKPFSFAAPFTTPSVDSEPEAVESNQSFCDKVMALDEGDTLNLGCSREEASQIYEETRSHRQSGRMRVDYRDGTLTARKVKD
jgi:hypothetical protein